MSIRRNPGEIVKRKPGSGFIGSAEPELIRVPDGQEYNEAEPWCMLCLDPDCREYANLEIVNEKFERTNNFLYHISECQMETVAPF